jgi:hypothetical protein
MTTGVRSGKDWTRLIRLLDLRLHRVEYRHVMEMQLMRERLLAAQEQMMANRNADEQKMKEERRNDREKRRPKEKPTKKGWTPILKQCKKGWRDR